MSRSPRVRRLSLPQEHGGYLTLAGATLAAVGIAPEPAGALGMGLVLSAAFVARGAVDRLAAGLALARWDLPALAALLALAALGSALVARAAPALGPVAVAAAALLVGASSAVRRLRRHRAPGLEAVAMLALGASAGLAAAAGRAPARASILLGVIVGAHVLASVPLVRTRLRRGERARAAQAAAAAAAVIVAAAGVIALAGRPLACLALLPRAIEAAWLLARRRSGEVARAAGRPPASPVALGLREAVVLAVVAIGAAVTVG